MQSFVEPRLLPVDDVLGAVYRIDLPLDTWLAELRKLRIFDDAASLTFVLQREVDDWVLAAADMDAIGRTIIERTKSQWSRADEIVPRNLLCGAQSEAMNCFPLPSPWREVYDDCGIADSWAIFARAAEGRIVGISHALSKRARTSLSARRFWSAVAIHLTAAARLRTAIEKGPEAVLGPDGKVVHAEGIARTPRSREALRHATRAIDRARRRGSDPLAAIESWSAMVSGRWSLVDQFESDGRRFVVARINEPTLAPHANLSAQERHVVALVTMGRSNKEIAYELGVRTTSVAGYLHRIYKKLGVRRADLIT